MCDQLPQQISRFCPKRHGNSPIWKSRPSPTENDNDDRYAQCLLFLHQRMDTSIKFQFCTATPSFRTIRLYREPSASGRNIMKEFYAYLPTGAVHGPACDRAGPGINGMQCGPQPVAALVEVKIEGFPIWFYMSRWIRFDEPTKRGCLKRKMKALSIE